MYIVRLEECTSRIVKNFYLRCSFCSVIHSELFLAGIGQKSQPHPPPPKKSIGATPYGFKNLYPSKKAATVTQQLTKSIDVRHNYVCDCHLRGKVPSWRRLGRLLCVLKLLLLIHGCWSQLLRKWRRRKYLRKKIVWRSSRMQWPWKQKPQEQQPGSSRGTAARGGAVSRATAGAAAKRAAKWSSHERNSPGSGIYMSSSHTLEKLSNYKS